MNIDQIGLLNYKWEVNKAGAKQKTSGINSGGHIFTFKNKA